MCSLLLCDIKSRRSSKVCKHVRKYGQNYGNELLLETKVPMWLAKYYVWITNTWKLIFYHFNFKLKLMHLLSDIILAKMLYLPKQGNSYFKHKICTWKQIWQTKFSGKFWQGIGLLLPVSLVFLKKVCNLCYYFL